MNGDDKKSVLPISGLLLALAALGFLKFSELPFVAPRPQVSAIRESSKKVQARLWQDPFRAVLNYNAKTKSPLKDEGRFCIAGSPKNCLNSEDILRKQITERSEKGRVIVLGVMDFAAPYAEETEDRVRRRYATLTALGKDYIPYDPEHIDFLRIVDGTNDAGISMSKIMPFEWFSLGEKSCGKHCDSVLILWLNDGVFRGKPLTKLRRLADYLGLYEDNSLKNDIDFKIIGPAGSTLSGRRGIRGRPKPGGRLDQGDRGPGQRFL